MSQATAGTAIDPRGPEKLDEEQIPAPDLRGNELGQDVERDREAPDTESHQEARGEEGGVVPGDRRQGPEDGDDRPAGQEDGSPPPPIPQRPEDQRPRQGPKEDDAGDRRGLRVGEVPLRAQDSGKEGQQHDLHGVCREAEAGGKEDAELEAPGAQRVDGGVDGDGPGR